MENHQSGSRRSQSYAATGEIQRRINVDVVRPPGSECWIWVGQRGGKDMQPVVYHAGHLWRVKQFLRRGWEPAPARGVVRTYRTSCGIGLRCVAPKHQVLKQEVPHAEWASRLNALRPQSGERRHRPPGLGDRL